ncbi:hypothetical protein BJ508DRAFT_316425, partial [Ascobolus immersus RN42]
RSNGIRRDSSVNHDGNRHGEATSRGQSLSRGFLNSSTSGYCSKETLTPGRQRTPANAAQTFGLGSPGRQTSLSLRPSPVPSRTERTESPSAQLLAAARKTYMGVREIPDSTSPETKETANPPAPTSFGSGPRLTPTPPNRVKSLQPLTQSPELGIEEVGEKETTGLKLGLLFAPGANSLGDSGAGLGEGGEQMAEGQHEGDQSNLEDDDTAMPDVHNQPEEEEKRPRKGSSPPLDLRRGLSEDDSGDEEEGMEDEDKAVDEAGATGDVDLLSGLDDAGDTGNVERLNEGDPSVDPPGTKDEAGDGQPPVGSSGNLGIMDLDSAKTSKRPPTTAEIVDTSMTDGTVPSDSGTDHSTARSAVPGTDTVMEDINQEKVSDVDANGLPAPIEDKNSTPLTTATSGGISK